MKKNRLLVVVAVIAIIFIFFRGAIQRMLNPNGNTGGIWAGPAYNPNTSGQWGWVGGAASGLGDLIGSIAGIFKKSGSVNGSGDGDLSGGTDNGDDYDYT